MDARGGFLRQSHVVRTARALLHAWKVSSRSLRLSRSVTAHIDQQWSCYRMRASLRGWAALARAVAAFEVRCALHAEDLCQRRYWQTCSVLIVAWHEEAHRRRREADQ